MNWKKSKPRTKKQPDTSSAENLTTIPQKDTTGIVMQSTVYSCESAALATALHTSPSTFTSPPLPEVISLITTASNYL